MLLLRTIGIRDLVLGLGTVAASRSGAPGEAHRWTTMALASDSLDVGASLASMRAIGKRDALVAAAVALVFAVKDAYIRSALGSIEDATTEPVAP